MDEKKTDEVQAEAKAERPHAIPATELKDEELNSVTGGYNDGLTGYGDIYDRKGRWIGCNIPQWGDIWHTRQVDQIRFYPCTCGRPMHQGTLNFWYCDPCDRFEMSPSMYFYDGSLSQFQSSFCY